MCVRGRGSPGEAGGVRAEPKGVEPEVTGEGAVCDKCGEESPVRFSHSSVRGPPKSAHLSDQARRGPGDPGRLARSDGRLVHSLRWAGALVPGSHIWRSAARACTARVGAATEAMLTRARAAILLSGVSFRTRIPVGGAAPLSEGGERGAVARLRLGRSDRAVCLPARGRRCAGSGATAAPGVTRRLIAPRAPPTAHRLRSSADLPHHSPSPPPTAPRHPRRGFRER